MMDEKEISGKHIATVQAAQLLAHARSGSIRLSYASNPYVDEATKKAANDELDRIIWNLNNRADRLFDRLGKVMHGYTA